MTANQINYGRNLEYERANRANEQLQRQKMWNDWMIANLQAQTAEARRQTDVAINQAQIESREFINAMERGLQQRQFETHLQQVETPQLSINVSDVENRREQTEVSRQRVWFDFVSNLANSAIRSGFMSLF